MTLLDTPKAAQPAQDQAGNLRRLFQNGGETPVLRETPPAPVRLPAEPPAPTRRARTIAITSGKGGVGKTNLAVNLAACFARADKRTLLIDADMGLANADVICGLDLRHNLAHVIARRLSFADVIATGPGGFRLVAGASGLARMADLPAEEHERLLRGLRSLERAHDLILIDTGAGISPNVLSFTASADGVLVVTTPEPTAITDAYATIKVILRGRPDAPISLLVNEAKNAHEAAGVYERMAATARRFLDADLADAGWVPIDPAVSRAVRRRKPFVLDQPNSGASRALVRLAGRLTSGVGDAASTSNSSGFFGRVLRR